jgi:putative two-component system response regulator
MRDAMLSISRSEAARPPAELGDMRILVACDLDADIELIDDLLSRDGYSDVVTVQDLERAVALVTEWEPDLLLVGGRISSVDVMTAIGDAVPVLVHSAHVTAEALLLSVRNLLGVRRRQHQLNHRQTLLAEAVRARTLQLDHARLESLSILAIAAEYRDDETREHTQRVGRIAAMIAQALDMAEPDVALIRDAAPLHDIGKVGIPDYVLLKRGRLTPDERQIMMRHVEIGARILAPAGSPVLMTAASIARTHHERWDGAGYLEGLHSDEIPLAGRITAIADVFDALTHERPYKAAWDVDRALAEIAAQAGKQFDPLVAGVFASLDVDLLSDEIAAQ